MMKKQFDEIKIKEAFKVYLTAKGYTVGGLGLYSTTNGVFATVIGHDVNLKDFTRVRRYCHKYSLVTLEKKDFKNVLITDNLFNPLQ